MRRDGRAGIIRKILDKVFPSVLARIHGSGEVRIFVYTGGCGVEEESKGDGSRANSR